MANLDSVTWQALGLVLTVVGLVVSAVVWARRGPARGLRAVAWSLLPLAAGLTGVLRLVGEIAEAVLRWASRLVFSPVVWVGLLVAAASAVLFVVGGLLLRRAHSSPNRRAGPSSSRHAGPSPNKPVTRGSAGAGDDLADIEEILRKRGIQ